MILDVFYSRTYSFFSQALRANIFIKCLLHTLVHRRVRFYLTVWGEEEKKRNASET